MKYIDSEKLIAEIERRIKEHDAIIDSQQGSERAERHAWEWAECKWFLTLIASLQQEQPEVEEEKEVEEWWQNWASPPRNEYAVFNKEEFINLARHFYELGKNSK